MLNEKANVTFKIFEIKFLCRNLKEIRILMKLGRNIFIISSGVSLNYYSMVGRYFLGKLTHYFQRLLILLCVIKSHVLKASNLIIMPSTHCRAE